LLCTAGVSHNQPSAMMRDPEEVREEERKRAYEVQRKKEQQMALYVAYYESCGSFYRFQDVHGMATNFLAEVDKNSPTKVEDADRKLWRLLEADGHPALEVAIPRANVDVVVSKWINKRFKLDTRTTVRAVEVLNDVDVEKAGQRGEIDVMAGFWTFQQVVKFTKYYEISYLETNQLAGFKSGDVAGFKDLYDKHKGGSEELKPAQLWGLLEEMSLQYPSVEEQEHVKRVLNEVDMDKNGALGLFELLHLVRRLLDEQKDPPREQEYRLMRDSKMPLQEAEEWAHLHQAHAGDRGYIIIADVKKVFEGMLKINNDGAKQMSAWLSEVDEDANGQIDLGEWIALVQKMWDTDFCGLKKLV